MNVFTYGSLMFDPVWSQVVSGTYTSENAVISGFQRRAIKDESFPAIIESSADETIEGVVYRNVSLADIEKLDWFEGELYLRKTQPVSTADGVVDAEVYILERDWYHLLEGHAWDVEAFQRSHLQTFVKECFEFMGEQEK